MRGLNGKAAVVTGGTRGIGYACAKRLLEEGVSVLITGRNPERGENAALELAKINPNVRFLSGDMADEAFCKKVITTAIEAFGRLDYLVNNAFPFTAKALEATREDWLHTMEAGPIAYAAMIQQFVQQRGMEKGAIVNMSSISAHIAQPARWTYNVAKGAVSQLTRCAAIDLAPHIRVNAVCPGWVWTDEVAKATNGEGRERWEPIWGDFHMVMRLQEPEEIAAAVVYLLSDDASAVTGSNMDASGGYLAMGSEGLGKQSKFAGSQ